MRDSVVAVIQARTGSSRLPGKVLLPLGGSTVLEQMMARVMRARTLDDLVVATTTHPDDDAIVERMTEIGITCIRGSEHDLLDRHLQAAVATWAAHVVKIPSDCPLIDPAVIDAVVIDYLDRPGAVDYASNLHPASWPDGNDVEVISRRALEIAWNEATEPWQREHTSPFIWDRPDRFRLLNVPMPGGTDLSRRWRHVLDYPEDYQVIRTVFDALHPIDPEFGTAAIVDFLERHPAIADLNAVYRGQQWHDQHRHQLRTLQEQVA